MNGTYSKELTLVLRIMDRQLFLIHIFKTERTIKTVVLIPSNGGEDFDA